MKTSRERPRDWHPVSKFFHWSTAVLILAMFGLGWLAVSYSMSPTKIALFNWHKSLGLLVLAWVILRLAWRVTHRSPAPPVNTTRVERWAAHLAHAMLYVLMIAMPISGWIINSAADFPLAWFGLFQVPQITGPDPDLQNTAESVHLVLFWTMLAVILLHAAAALTHHYSRNNDVLVRMLPVRRTGQ